MRRKTHFSQPNQDRFKKPSLPHPYHQPPKYSPNIPTHHSNKTSQHIATVPFSELPEITRQNLNQHTESFRNFLSKHIRASSELEEAINTIILNLFLNSPAKVVQSGKTDYNHAEREYTRRQLMEYLQGINCLEAHSFPRQTTLGNFTRKERQVIEDFIHSDFPYKGTCHLAYVDDTAKSNWEKYVQNKKERLRDTLVAQCDSELERIQVEMTEFKNKKPEEFKKEEQAIETLLKTIKTKLYGSSDKELAEEQEENFILNAIKNLQQNEGFISQKMAMVLSVGLRSLRYQRKNSPELEAEFRNNPTYDQILEKIISCIAPKGVLILNPAQQREFTGMKYLGEYGKVGMYQKVL